ncbi:WLM-domain-containing protein [Cylindrobasidium torrendii FP15055 ss-10]|uniref:WLM-domain-containing protein n=1 Tax=Cylindrobasidium torrendii FP15055 ss-10 TaxID=1314674 RepID=A0A0D7BV57_9AGAR|nr:WLM-domain-containing protein [Cylindrobasidium torrendii FP15055 ss-10]
MSTDHWVDSYTHLKNMKRADEALSILKKVASFVKPIMRSHKWRLPVLAEFFPKEENLLGMNVNRGRKILLRLRPPYDSDAFLTFEDIIGTMLHELTHNVHGPHDEKFYKYLSGLQDEYDNLARTGYAGEGFFSAGRRLGAGHSHNLPLHVSKARALAAAEKRDRVGRVMGDSGGQKLGQSGRIQSKLSPRELAVQAAERRARDERACGQGKRAEEEAVKAAENSIIDLTGDSDIDDEEDDDEVLIVADSRDAAKHLPGPSKLPASPAKAPVKRTRSPTIHGGKPSSKRARLPLTPEGVDSDWSCVVCTLVNSPQALQCDACSSTRPARSTVGWTCLVCGQGPIPHDFWTCRICSTVKSTS